MTEPRSPGGPERTALLIVDVQNDFCEGGALAVEGGAAVARRISDHVHAHAGDYAAVVATRDLHEDPGDHFATQPDYVDTWPPHCVRDTPGASFHPALDVGPVQAVFDKGARSAAYSGFEGATSDGTPLAGWLESHRVTRVVVTGLATDHCVRATALDAVHGGYATVVRLDLAAGVAQETTAAAIQEMADAGVNLASGDPAPPSMPVAR